MSGGQPIASAPRTDHVSEAEQLAALARVHELLVPHGISLDGYGSHSGDWGGYWGKQGPELLDHRLALYGEQQRMVFGANTYRAFGRMLASSTEESEVRDPWVTRMRSMPATVVSTTVEGTPRLAGRDRRAR
jgi:hypothetical protein